MHAPLRWLGRGALFAAIAAFAFGCASYEPEPLPPDHPANPEAPESPAPPPSKTLDVAAADPIPKVEAATLPHAGHGGHEGHGAATASPAPGHEAHGGATPPEAPAPSEAKVASTCPMHPEVASEKPGSCPKCGMDLVPAAKPSEPPAAAPAPEGDSAAKPALPPAAAYVCPMHPEVTSEKPDRCPKCGMDLAPRTEAGGAKPR